LNRDKPKQSSESKTDPAHIFSVSFAGQQGDGIKHGEELRKQKDELRASASKVASKLKSIQPRPCNFVAIDASQIAKWSPNHPLWPTWEENVKIIAREAEKITALKWKDAGDKPKDGIRLDNHALARELDWKAWFTHDEWMRFNVDESSLTKKHFVEVRPKKGGEVKYFQPDNGAVGMFISAKSKSEISKAFAKVAEAMVVEEEEDQGGVDEEA